MGIDNVNIQGGEMNLIKNQKGEMVQEAISCLKIGKGSNIKK